MFIDLYNPGSLEARELNDQVNRLFVVSMIFAVPLLYDKAVRFSKWYHTSQTLSQEELNATILKTIKPVLVQVGIVILLSVIASIIIATYFNIPPEVIQNYQNYYSGYDSFNYYNLNNISNKTVCCLNLTGE